MNVPWSCTSVCVLSEWPRAPRRALAALPSCASAGAGVGVGVGVGVLMHERAAPAGSSQTICRCGTQRSLWKARTWRPTCGTWSWVRPRARHVLRAACCARFARVAATATATTTPAQPPAARPPRARADHPVPAQRRRPRRRLRGSETTPVASLGARVRPFVCLTPDSATVRPQRWRPAGSASPSARPTRRSVSAASCASTAA